VPFSKLPNPVTSLRPFAIFTSSRQLNALNTNSFHLLIKFSPPAYLHIWPPHYNSTSQQHSFFITCNSRLSTYIIFSMNNWLLLSVCLTLPLKPASFFTLSTAPHLWFFSFCFPHFYFLCCISSFIIYNLLFHSHLKTYPIHKSFPPRNLFLPQEWLHGLPTASGISEIFFLSLVSPIIFLVMAQCGGLSSLDQLLSVL